MALIGWDNIVERPTTALPGAFPGTAAGMGVEQLRVPVGNPACALQSPQGVTALHFEIRFPAAPVRAVMLARTNLTPAAQLQVVADGYFWAGGAGVVAGIGQALHVLPAAVTTTWLGITVADAGNPDGFLNLPLCWAGDGVEQNIGYESTEARVVRRQDVTTRAGTVMPQPLSLQRSWSLRVPVLGDAQAAAWTGPLEAAAAAGRNILVIPRLGAPAAREAVLGLLESGPRGFIGGSGAYRTWSATITERL